MIRVEHIDKYFNKFKKNAIHVINDTSLEFDNSGLVALLGPSGSGKTTLLNVIGGLDKVRKGNIFVNGKKITRRSQNYVDKIRNLNIGYIFQDYKLIEDMSVYDNVSLVLKMLGIKDKKEIDKRVTYVLSKVGMLRYKKRPCNMLSGGERQRVGIARAIVKNPNIIIADEPTGNLDSKNSVEIMNIIKAISKDKLVILVTHERNLAKFYASRIIELEDGKIVKDYINTNEDDLDYEMTNDLYLKDYKFMDRHNNINVYSNNNEPIKLNIVISNNNIYIKSLDNKDIEAVDDESTIKMIDDHYRNISKQDALKYEFNFKNIINDKYKLKYSSIFNPISFITSGFKKVFSFSILKKILLLGFFLSGIFIMYACSSILGSITISDKNFIKCNRNYLIVNQKKVNVGEYFNIENNLGADYIIPGDSVVSLALKVDDFYQTSNYRLMIEGSLTDISTIDESSLMLGRMPENNQEFVVDKMVLDNVMKNEQTKMLGLTSYKKYLDRDVAINQVGNKKIVGIVDTNSPSFYMDRSSFINVLYHSAGSRDTSIESSVVSDDAESTNNYPYDDYTLYSNITMKEGRVPSNDYEVIVNISNKDDMPLNKEINKSINGTKLRVVGYYISADNLDSMLVNSNTIKYYLISKTSNISIYSSDKEEILNKAVDVFKLNIKDSYKYSRDQYISSKKDSIKSSIISSSIIIIISLIEMFLMMRSSFLSRVKEVGILRAIGVKKLDIYVMFSGEVIAITLLTSIPGILFSAYIMNILSKISFLDGTFIVNPMLVISAIVAVFIFNLVIGLLPVFNTIRKRPSEILSRTDI